MRIRWHNIAGLCIRTLILLHVADVAELFDTDLKGKSIGAARDCAVYCKALTERAKSLKGAEWQKYLNSGVLLFDIQKTLKQDLTGKLLSYLSSCKNNIGFFFEYQDALNAVCGDDVQLIDKRRNMFSKYTSEGMIPGKDILIRHYAGRKLRKENLKSVISGGNTPKKRPITGDWFWKSI